MGYEYKIMTKLTDRQLSEVQGLLMDNNTFDNKYEFNNEIWWEFRQPANSGKMPNCSVVFQDDGIYICQYLSPYLWESLDNLKDYMENNIVEFTLMSYDS